MRKRPMWRGSVIAQIKSVLLLTAIMTAVLLATAHAEAVTDTVLVKGFDRPWAVVPSPEGDIWITEKTGAIKIFNSKYVLQKTIRGLPDLAVYVEGGLLDLAFHPNYKVNRLIYVAYAVADSVGHHTRINRFRYDNGILKDHKVIFEGPSGTAGNHFGSRLAFDDQGYLYASFGERREWPKAQDLSTPHGKIVRLTDDGGIPSDNPFVSTANANPAIYTYGNRNPQGLAFHPVSKRLYESEHGPSSYEGLGGGGDEINEIARGANYGWPLAHHTMTEPGMTPPLLEYTPAIAPSGIAFYTGTKIPEWTNDLFVATLAGRHLLRVRINAAGAVLEQEKLLVGKYGRLRDVATAPDGTLLVISEPGQLIQLK